MNQAEVTPELFAGWVAAQRLRAIAAGYGRCTTAGWSHADAMAAVAAEADRRWPDTLDVLTRVLGAPYGPWRPLDRAARRRAARMMS